MIFLRQSHNIKPPRWGSPADVQYAIRKNSEKIYDCDPDNDVLVMPLFWGLPPLDYSGFNNHGTNHGAVFKDGNLNFNGIDNKITVDANTSLDTGNNLTISLWVKRNEALLADYKALVAYSEDVTDSQYSLFYNADERLSFWIYENISWRGFTGTAQIQDIKMHHIVLIWDGANIWTYIDGSEDNTGAFAYIPNNNMETLWIGNEKTAGRELDGQISEVRVSGTARTANQIALSHDRPWDLYRPVSRPVYSIPAVGVTIPIFMQNMRGGYNLMSRGGFIN